MFQAALIVIVSSVNLGNHVRVNRGMKEPFVSWRPWALDQDGGEAGRISDLHKSKSQNLGKDAICVRCAVKENETFRHLETYADVVK